MKIRSGFVSNSSSSSWLISTRKPIDTPEGQQEVRNSVECVFEDILAEALSWCCYGSEEEIEERKARTLEEVTVESVVEYVVQSASPLKDNLEQMFYDEINDIPTPYDIAVSSIDFYRFDGFLKRENELLREARYSVTTLQDAFRKEKFEKERLPTIIKKHGDNLVIVHVGNDMGGTIASVLETYPLPWIVVMTENNH